MYRKVAKGLASVLGAALVLGSLVMSAVPAQAATSKKGDNGYETTYTMKELTLIKKDDVVTADADGTSVSLSYGVDWSNAYYTIPAEVLSAGLKGGTCNIDSTDNLVVKFVTDSYSDVGDVAVFGKTVDLSNQDAAAIATVKNIGVAGQQNAAFKLDSITFVTENEVALGSDDDANNGGDNVDIGGDDANSGNDTPAEPEKKPADDNNAPKTGDSMNSVLVVSVLGGLLLIAAGGMILTRQRRSR